MENRIRHHFHLPHENVPHKGTVYKIPGPILLSLPPTMLTVKGSWTSVEHHELKAFLVHEVCTASHRYRSRLPPLQTEVGSLPTK